MALKTFFLASILALAAAKGFKASTFSYPAKQAAFQNFVVQSSLASVPDGFTKVGPAPASSSVNLRIAVASKNMAGLEQALLDVSAPSSAKYGKHLTKAEVNAFVAPSDKAAAAVKAWLSSHGLIAATSSSAGHWLSVSVPISKANTILSASYQTFKNVADFIDHIHPTTAFSGPHSRGPVVSISQPASAVSANGVPASCSSAITPACLQALYEIPATPATEYSNSIAVAGFVNEFARRADLSHFLKSFRTDMSRTTTFMTQKFDDGRNPQNATTAGLEADLDIQYTVGIATGVPVSFVSVGNTFQDGALQGFLDIVNFLLEEDEVPQVMSTSYDSGEADVPQDLALKLCEAYMALGARATSILFSTGDFGVAGNRAQNCTTFQPAFPVGCPYVTAVGSTGGIAPERGSSFSSGGFSNFFSTPDYQADAVAAAGILPDVSAQGENVQIILGGVVTPVQGTSCSTPIFASIVSLLNDQLIAGGKPPLGFLSPWLYANPGMFTDITAGSNPGCGTDGFATSVGWDPVTGLGTPIFTKMRAAAGLR
ncbi:subtilisin-like protein [Mycena rosella]|uniref:Subtilisin-like protein n=1 Tax=Mycena rosella TaxID=1033263 RepID=A0AAD7GTM6_MYCRO|nr:subtilisin-like protein [Mycena rosella]